MLFQLYFEMQDVPPVYKYTLVKSKMFAGEGKLLNRMYIP